MFGVPVLTLQRFMYGCSRFAFVSIRVNSRMKTFVPFVPFVPLLFQINPVAAWRLCAFALRKICVHPCPSLVKKASALCLRANSRMKTFVLPIPSLIPRHVSRITLQFYLAAAAMSGRKITSRPFQLSLPM